MASPRETSAGSLRGAGFSCDNPAATRDGAVSARTLEGLEETMAAKEIVCAMCGFKNAANLARCVSCGAKLEAHSAVDYTEEEAAARRHQQETFEWKWALMAFGIYLVLQVLVIGLLPLVISSYDPQGLAGLGISVAVWFIGGTVVGFVSPGKTFIEPAVGALIAVVPTVGYLMFITPEGFEPTFLAYLIGGLIGAMISLFGAFLGEKLQLTVRGPRKA